MGKGCPNAIQPRESVPHIRPQGCPTHGDILLLPLSGSIGLFPAIGVGISILSCDFGPNAVPSVGCTKEIVAGRHQTYLKIRDSGVAETKSSVPIQQVPHLQLSVERMARCSYCEIGEKG